jgi:hypothetical protein
MSDELKLKPCPFCGFEAELRADDSGEAWTPECRATERGGAHEHGHIDFPWYWKKADAAEAWNTRAGESALVREVVAETLKRASWRLVTAGRLVDLDKLADEFAAEIIAGREPKP